MDGPEIWTDKTVADRLIEAFRSIPNHPVFSDRGRFKVIGVVGAGEVLNWPSLYVSDSQARKVLMTWARCRATGESVRQRFNDLGWPRTAADERRRIALAEIAAALNAKFRLTPEPAEKEPQA